MMERTKSGDVHVLVMKNGENRFDLGFLDELNEHLDAIESDAAGPGALVLAGEGKFFSTGLNLDFIMNADGPTQQRFFTSFGATMRRLLALPIPTIAALNGHAFAAGAFLALMCDFRIQREDRGWICVSEVDVGVLIGDEMMQLLAAKLPAATARQAVLTGKRYDAREALAAGFVDATASESDLLAHAEEFVAPLATKERQIFTALKNSLNASIAEAFQAPT